MKKFLLKLYDFFYDTNKSIKVLKNKLVSIIKKPPIVKTTDDTLYKIISDKCSVSRYGNAEFDLMFKKDGPFFQDFNNELRLRLIEIIRSQGKNHIVCIPDIFVDVDKFMDYGKNFWTKYLNINRSKIYQELDMKKVYFDALVTRLYIDYKDKSKAGERFKKIKRIWDNRDIILVEGELSRLGAGNDLFNNAKSLKRILCPAENAFLKYEKILNSIKKYDTSNLILLALGPTATVLAYDLSKMGYQAVDIGNIDIEYEWFLQRTLVKVPVKHKYTCEVPNGTKVEKLENPEYVDQILAQIL